MTIVLPVYVLDVHVSPGDPPVGHLRTLDDRQLVAKDLP